MKITNKVPILFGIFALVIIYAVMFYTKQFVYREAVISFKKLFITYSQALELTVLDLDGETGCYFSTDGNIKNEFDGCDKFYKKFATNLKVTKYCKNNSLSNGCLPVYKTYTTKPECAGYSESMMNRYNQTFVMNDKSSLTVFNQPTGMPKPMFAVDSNGKTFPNKSGYDLFSLVIIRNVNGHYSFHPNVTHCLPLEKGGIHKLQDVFN